MIDGIAMLSEGLLDATLERGAKERLDATLAVRTEAKEIEIFLQALNNGNGSSEHVGKRMAEMIYGIAIFAGGLFKATLEQNSPSSRDIRVVFQRKVEEVSEFLGQLETKHQELKSNHSPEETMRMAVEWIADQEK